MKFAFQVSCKGDTIVVTNSLVMLLSACHDFVVSGNPEPTDIIEVDVWELDQGILFESRGFVPVKEEIDIIEKWVNECL